MKPVEFFSSTYSQARSKFTSACHTSGIYLDTYAHPLAGPGGEDIAIDVAWIGPQDASLVLVMLSGTHGVEGFCGSAIQTGWIESGLWKELPSQTALLMIHALNPYGFSHLRRANEDNIDLNRNFVDFLKPLPENKPFDELVYALCPREWTETSRRLCEDYLQSYIKKVGKRAYQSATFDGQHSYPDAIFYGGRAPSWSHHKLRAIIQKYLVHKKHVALIDYHTGLGPYGYGERLSMYDPKSEEDKRLGAWLNNDVVSTRTGKSKSTEVKGVVLSAFYDLLGKNTTCFGLEFGTYPLDDVLYSLRAETGFFILAT